MTNTNFQKLVPVIKWAGGNRNASYGILRAYNGHVYYYNIYGSNDLLAVYGIVTYDENT